jgi:hypothetical protein
VALIGCARSGRRSVPEAGDDVAQARPSPSARLPLTPSQLAPAMIRVEGSGAIDGGEMADGADLCVPCHADAVAQWKTSAHAFASFSNPIYRSSVERYRKAVGRKASRFCAGCHDPALLIDGAIDDPVQPDDPRAHGGVGCLTCHSISAARRDGNGSYTLRTDPVVMPVEGDSASLRAHRARLTMPPLRTVELCGTCHRAFLGVATGQGHHLPATDDYGAWLSSAYAGNHLRRVDFTVSGGEPKPIAEAACRDCHMQLVHAPDDRAADDGKLHSHRFTGGHTWLAAMRGDTATVGRVRDRLRHAARVEIGAVRRADGSLATDLAALDVAPGEAIDLEVVITNERVGHRFPGGALDLHDVWVEVVVEDGLGEALASHGMRTATGQPHVLHAVMVDAQGKPVTAHRIEDFRAPVYDTTIAARDSVVIPYRFVVPDGLGAERRPLRARVRLLHRSRERDLFAAACEDDDRAAYERITPLDPCKPQPVTVVASTSVRLGGGSPASELAVPDAERLLRHGTGWQHVLVEEIDKARPSLTRIVDGLAAGTPATVSLIGAAQHQLALVAARQGRIDEMALWLSRAERNVPGHPALAFVRGQALSSVWRHDDAIPWLRVAASGAPSDPSGWRSLAIGLGSIGQHAGALSAAHRGLAFAPRDPDLLRVQTLALEGLPGPEGEVTSARAAFVMHRRRDDGPELRSACADASARCALERTPAHVHVLVPHSSTVGR